MDNLWIILSFIVMFSTSFSLILLKLLTNTKLDVKILLTGATGQLGSEILKSTPKEMELINPGREELDLSDYESCKKFVLKINPDWIINCGAYTAVDAAEKDFHICKKINSFAPQAFSEVINETKSKYVGEVFEGGLLHFFTAYSYLQIYLNINW